MGRRYEAIGLAMAKATAGAGDGRGVDGVERGVAEWLKSSFN